MKLIERAILVQIIYFFFSDGMILLPHPGTKVAVDAVTFTLSRLCPASSCATHLIYFGSCACGIAACGFYSNLLSASRFYLLICPRLSAFRLAVLIPLLWHITSQSSGIADPFVRVPSFQNREMNGNGPGRF